MPQFNHYEVQQGRIIDPTFGLNALDAETKRKTKARELQNTASQVLRQQLGQRGKGLSDGTVATVSEGGDIEFSGKNAAVDESRLYNIGTADYGKKGKGVTVNESVSRDAVEALKSQFNARNAQAVQGQAGMQAVGNKAIGAYNATTLNTTLPTATNAPTTTGTGTAATPTPISPVTISALNRVLPASLINPSSLVMAPSSSSPQAAASTNTQQQQQDSSSVSAGTSVSYATGGATNSYEGTPQVDTITNSDVEVRDQLNMNQSDLMVNDAMQALAFHLSGGTSPGTYRHAMEVNAKTMGATNEALSKQGTSHTIKVGGEHESTSSPNTSVHLSKEQKASSGSSGPRQAPNIKKFYNPKGQDVDVESKNGMLQFDGNVNGVSLIYEPNILLHSQNQQTFVKSFNDHYSKEGYKKREYKIEKDKDGVDYIYIKGKRVGYVSEASSTIQVDKATGKMSYGEVPSYQTYGLVFTSPVSELDFNQITQQGAR